MRVLVIGGGIVGLTVVREFLRHGIKDIVLFDKGQLGNEASFAAAGMLAPQAESDLDDTFFRFCSSARDFYPGFAREIEHESEIDIELDREGTIYAAFDEADEEELAVRYTWQKAAGFDVERLSARETHKLEPFISPESIGSLYFPNDWQVENRELIRALIRIVQRTEVEINESSAIGSLKFDGDTVRGVETESGEEIEGDLIILATGAWTSLIETERKSVVLPSIRPVRGQMASYHAAKRFLLRVIYSPRGYVVPRKDGRILAGATVEDAGFEDKVTEHGISLIAENAVEIVPRLLNLETAEVWSGLRPRSIDGMPLIGELPGCRNLILSTGHYRNGILLAPFSARILVESIVNNSDSEFLDEFSLARSVRAAGLS